MVSAIFSIVLGVIMLAQWAFFLLTGGVPEVKTEPARVWLRIAAEWITQFYSSSVGSGCFPTFRGVYHWRFSPMGC